jgi:mRNA interferase MazF
VRRAEVWLVDFDPAVGSEIRKRRPAVVVNRGDAGILPLRVVIPFTDRKSAHSGLPWLVEVTPDASNGLDKMSSADAFQVKSIDTTRFVRRIGRLTPADMERLELALVAVLGLA